MNHATIETHESDTPRSDKCINEFRPGCLDFAWPLTVLCKQLERELASASRDAARYRWAREQPADVLLDLYCLIPGDETPEGFDAATDSAMNPKLIETKVSE